MSATIPDIVSKAAGNASESPRMRDWQRMILALLFLGYAGYYMCRVNFSVATPLLIKTFGHQGVDKKFIGAIASLGTLCYAAGKFINGSIVDFLGGRRMFLIGMGGAIFCTVLFGAGGVPFFTLAWMLNRFVQSGGWAGMVRVTSRWFSYSSYGAAMGVLSMSFLLGDVVWRLALGAMISNHWVDWKGVFYVSAAGLGTIFVANFLLLKEAPESIGEPEPAANPVNLFGESGQEVRQTGMLALLAPLLRSGMFWTICALSFGFTLVRETFNTWSPEFLHEVVKMDAGRAGEASAIFPLFGAFSALLCGFFADRLGTNGRAWLILGGLVLSVPALLALGYVPFGTSERLPLLLLGLVAFTILGPYTFLAGAIALDFGGKRGSATASGWIDGVGYLAGIFAGEGVGKLAQEHGWSAAFAALAGLTGLSCIAAVIYWFLQSARLKLVAGQAIAERDLAEHESLGQEGI